MLMCSFGYSSVNVMLFWTACLLEPGKVHVRLAGTEGILMSTPSKLTPNAWRHLSFRRMSDVVKSVQNVWCHECFHRMHIVCTVFLLYARILKTECVCNVLLMLCGLTRWKSRFLASGISMLWTKRTGCDRESYNYPRWKGRIFVALW